MFPSLDVTPHVPEQRRRRLFDYPGLQPAESSDVVSAMGFSGWGMDR
jgi:hypothetical protein